MQLDVRGLIGNGRGIGGGDGLMRMWVGLMRMWVGLDWFGLVWICDCGVKCNTLSIRMKETVWMMERA